MDLFDGNAMIGPRGVPGLKRTTTPAELLTEMDRLGIAEALVYHASAREGHPTEGNRRLLDLLAGQDRLHPCWVLLPDTGEMGPPQGVVAEMVSRGVRAARIFPTSQRFGVTEWCLGGLLAALEAERIPLFVDFEVGHWGDGRTDWRGVAEICTAHPRLPVIVVGESLAAPRHVYPLWRRCPNLYLETSYYQVHRGLADICARFGPDRLLFGTGFPHRPGGMPLAMLLLSEIDETAKARIGGDNLRQLLRLPAPRPVPCAPCPVPPSGIIDAHGHLGQWHSTYVHAGDAEGMLASMDRLGIQATCVSAFDAIGSDFRRGNDLVAEAMRRYPGRFLGYAVVNPNYPECMETELTRCFEELGFHALKFHCDLHQHPADGDGYRPALEYAQAHGLAVLIHGRITAALLEQYPQAQFLSAHVGGWDGRSRNEMVDLARDHSNLYLDLASSVASPGALERLVEAVGAGRIVHGSDYPLMDPAYQLGRVLYAEVDETAKERILKRNAGLLFRLEEKAGKGAWKPP